jgi:hypothetical protein
MQRFINNWAATLTAPATSGDLTLSVSPAQAALLAGLGSGDFYLLTLAEVVSDLETSWEIVKVTAAAGGVLTVERAQEGTTAYAWSVGASISARATAGTLEQLRSGGEPPAPAPDGRFGPPRPAVGQYLSAQVASGLVSGAQYFQASARLVPFEVSAQGTVDQLLCHATTAGTGREVRMAVYGSDANGWPAARLRETTALSAAVAGQIAGSIMPLELMPGQLYWLALQTSGAFFVFCMTAGSLLAQPTATDTAAQSISRALNFAAGLPADWAYTPSELSSLPAPYVLARRSA